jgi:hypothetical protein
MSSINIRHGTGTAAGSRDASSRLERRVMTAAQAALARQKFVTPIDVLIGVGWLEPAHVERWRHGRVAYLERVATANLHKLGTALRLLRRWAEHHGLTPRETVYITLTRDRRPLRFSASGDANIERAYRTHWVSPKPATTARSQTRPWMPRRPR